MHLKDLVVKTFAALLISLSASACSSTIEKESPAQTISLSLTTPNPSWSLAPVSAYQVGQEIWCVYELTQQDGMYTQVISKASTEFSIASANGSLKHFVLGKTWSWESDPNINFIDSMDDISDQLKDAVPIEIVRQ